MTEQQFRNNRNKEFDRLMPYYRSQQLSAEHSWHKSSSKRSVKGKAAGIHFHGKETRIISARFI